MARRKARVFLTGAVLAASLLVTVFAQAASGPRLEGVFKVKIKVIHSGPNSIYDAGETLRRHWQFFPKCPEGACVETILKRQTAESHRFIVLGRRGPGMYAGVTTFVAPSHDDRCHFRYHDEFGLRVTGARRIGGERRVTRMRIKLVQRMTSSDCRIEPREQLLVAQVYGRLR